MFSRLAYKPIIKKHKEQQEKVFSLYPVGGEFNYLGVKMMVAAHAESDGGYAGFSSAFAPSSPSIRCRYVDNRGGIRGISFECKEVLSWGDRL